MEVGSTMAVLSKRESDAQKLLELLANPFRAQVCFLDSFGVPILKSNIRYGSYHKIQSMQVSAHR